MMNHLIYTTFGEQNVSVYSTQVKQLLNFWSKRNTWKVTLIQIADEINFKELVPEVEVIFIKRKFKLLTSIHKRKYVNQIYNKLSVKDTDSLYFNSRGEAAYSIITNYLNKFNLNYRCNNLDIRGTIEEVKFSKNRRIFYLFFKYRLNKTLSYASSISTVTSNLKEHIFEKFSISSQNIKINVIPTLSIYEFNTNPIKKDLAFIGNIAWIEPNEFVRKILILNNLFNEKNWKISIIGNSNGNYGLDNHNIDFIERMSPVELENKILNYHTGLVLRDSSIINKVAAPCKISDYLCLGMPIIYSGEIGSINDFIMKFPECGKYILNINDISSPDKVNQHINISKSELEDLSMKAQSYFGVKSVIDKYIIHFNS